MEVERAEVANAVGNGRCRVGGELLEQRKRSRRTRAPHDVATGGGVPIVADPIEPCAEVAVPLPVAGDAERLEVPPILPVVLLREPRPELGGATTLIVA